MANYTINYLTGDTETVTADSIDYTGVQYIAYNVIDSRNSTTVAWIPAANVRSIHKQSDAETAG